MRFFSRLNSLNKKEFLVICIPSLQKQKIILMKLLLLFFFFFSSFLTAAPYPLIEVDPIYKDSELETLWNSITDINNPTLEDFLSVENYLKYGQRPYLDEIFNLPCLLRFIKEYNITVDRSYAFYNRILQRLMLVGPHKEMPVFQKLFLGGASPSDLSRCIVFYVSYNESPHPFDPGAIYSEKMLGIIRELETEGYQGHVLFRIGGYPLMDRGGLRLAHVPYSFKILSLIEASILGYENVLWLDSTIHPTNNLASVFSTLSEEGVFLLSTLSKMNLDYDYGLLSDAALAYSSVSIEDLFNIEQTSAAIIGVSFKNSRGHDLIQEWYRLTSAVYPAMTLYPEQFLLSVAVWRTKLNKKNFGSYTYQRSEVPTRPTQDQNRPFWFDKA